MQLNIDIDGISGRILRLEPIIVDMVGLLAQAVDSFHHHQNENMSYNCLI